MNRWMLGNALVTAGLLIVGFFRLMRGLYPLTWGGPNIGGGFIVVLAYIVIVIGLAFLAGEFAATRPIRRGAVQLAPAEPLQLSRPSVWIPGAVSIIAAAACLTMVFAPPGPGGNGRVGATGVTVDADGEPVLVLVVCERSIDTITLAGPNRGFVPNERLATLSAPSGGLTRTSLLPLVDLPAGWTGGPVAPAWQQRPADLVIATASGDESYLTQIAFTAAELGALDPATVQLPTSFVHPGQVVDREARPATSIVSLQDAESLICG